MGMGVLALFRHRSGVGGVNILALYLQDAYGIRAGWFQLALDIIIMLGSLFSSHGKTCFCRLWVRLR